MLRKQNWNPKNQQIVILNFAQDNYEASSLLCSIYNDEEKPIHKTTRRDFDILKAENTINLNFLQVEESIFPTWQLEDYFIL